MMLQKLGSFGIIAFLISLVLGFICLFYILQIIIKKQVTIKILAESMGESAKDTGIIAFVCTVLGILSACFFSVCIGIYIFTTNM
jgi:hypothetical protein